MWSASHRADVADTAEAVGSARRTSGTSALATSVSVTLVGRAAASIGSLTVGLLLHGGHLGRVLGYPGPRGPGRRRQGSLQTPSGIVCGETGSPVDHAPHNAQPTFGNSTPETAGGLRKDKSIPRGRSAKVFVGMGLVRTHASYTEVMSH